MHIILDVLIPRFVTEDVAVNLIDGNYEVVCNILDLEDGDEYDQIITIKSFNLFGFGLFPRLFIHYTEDNDDDCQ